MISTGAVSVPLHTITGVSPPRHAVPATLPGSWGVQVGDQPGHLLKRGRANVQMQRSQPPSRRHHSPTGSVALIRPRGHGSSGYGEDSVALLSPTIA